MIHDKDEHVWAQKFRPQTLDDVVIPDSFKDSLKKSIADGHIPSMLLYSPSPGTGKTTTALAVCHDLDIKPLFINASLNNSIDDIRMKVVQYATTASLLGGNQKVVVLDECERLSTAAQESLKGLMEQVSKNCSFILTTNAKSRIVVPLRSRCTEVDFVYTDTDKTQMATKMLKRCFEILDFEKVTYDRMAVAAVVKKFIPDNRKILNELQRYNNENGSIDAGIMGRLKAADTETLISAMRAKKWDEVKAWCFDNADALGDDFYRRTFLTLETLLTPQTVPAMVLILNRGQQQHSTVPDRFIHFLGMMTEIMMDTQFK